MMLNCNYIYIKLLIIFLFFNITLVYSDGLQVIKKDGKVILKNEHVVLNFSDDNNFKILKFIVNGKDIAPKETNEKVYPWLLTYLGTKGENPVLSPRFAIFKGSDIVNEENKSTVIFKWDVLLSDSTYMVKTFVSLYEMSELPEWNISVDVPKGWVITGLEFPRILLSKPNNAKAIISSGYGVEYNLTDTGLLQSRYPSAGGCMQLLLVHNNEGSIYYSTLDKQACDKTLAVKGYYNNILLYTNIVASYGWTKNGKFKLPWSSVVGYSDKGWEYAVNSWYRPFSFETEWGRLTVDKRNNITEWVKNADMWLRTTGVSQKKEDDLIKAINYFGKNIGVHWYSWHNYKFDVKYPEYFPFKKGFDKMVEKTQKAGGFVTPYINGRLWDVTTQSYITKEGNKASCRKPDGTLYTEIYNSKVLNTVTCPASNIWQDIITDLTEKILTEIKTDGVYLDQVAAARCEPCYAENHNHAKGGGCWWHYAYRNLINNIRNNILEKNQALTSEENAECYMDLFDMLLIVNTRHSDFEKMVPLFPLVYSDRAVYSGYTYIPDKYYNKTLKYMTMRSLLWGAQLGWVQPYKIMQATEEAEFLKNLTGFRKKNHDIFLGGRFIREFVPKGDNPSIVIEDYEKTNVVLSAEWKNINNQNYYIVVNMDNKTHKVLLPNNKSVEIGKLNCMKIKLYEN